MVSFVCAMASKCMDKVPTLFRSWEAEKNPGYNCRIWEAARATSAAPRLFKQIKIGDPRREISYVDGALGCNNPVNYVISEAIREFGESRPVGCILSVGTGLHRVPGFEPPSGSRRLLPIDLIKVLTRMATDSDEAETQMSKKFRNVADLYHRLNAGIELGEIKLYEWKRLSEVQAHTNAYLNTENVQRQLDVIVDALVGLPTQRVPLGLLCQF